MVSGGLAVTALAGCGGAMEEQSRARRQRSRRGLRRRQKIIKVTTFALPDGPEESEIYVEPIADLPDDLSGEWMRPRYFHWRTAA